jgi:hypothetical protein
MEEQDKETRLYFKGDNISENDNKKISDHDFMAGLYFRK